MSESKNYRRKGTCKARPYIPGEDLTGIYVRPQVKPEAGGYITELPPDNPSAIKKTYQGKDEFERNWEEEPNNNKVPITDTGLPTNPGG